MLGWGVLSYLCLWDLIQSSVPVPLGEGLPGPPIPGREGSSSWRTACPALALSLKDHFKYFPFLVPMEPFQGAAKSCARAEQGCASGSTHRTWPWLLSAPSLFPLLLSWLLAEN